MATLPSVWHYRVSAGTGWPGDSILWLGEVEKFDLQLLSQCGSTYNCLSSSVPEIYEHVARMLSNQQKPTTNQAIVTTTIPKCITFRHYSATLITRIFPLRVKSVCCTDSTRMDIWIHLIWGDAWCNGWHVCFPSLPPMLLRGFESRLGLESSGCRMWHFLKLVARGFLWVLRFPPLLHRFNGSANKIKLK